MIDLFVDIAVLLRKLVYRFSGTQVIHLPRRTPAELLDTCTMQYAASEMSSRIASYAYTPASVLY